MASRVGSAVAALATAVLAVAAFLIVATGVVSTVYGVYVALSGAGFDHTSPVPQGQRVIATSGVVAVAVVAVVVVAAVVCGMATDWPDGEDLGSALGLVVALVLAGSASAAPLHMRVNTLDVTDTGFRRAEYGAPLSGPSHLNIYNARTVPIEICVSANGVCQDWLHRTVDGRHRTKLGWPEKVHGEFTLSIVSPLPAGARGSTLLRLVEPPDPPNDPGSPFGPPAPPPPPPNWPPIHQPPIR